MTPNPHSPIDEGERWRLQVGDGAVTVLQIDHGFGLSIETSMHIRIEEAFEVASAEGSTSFDPGVRGAVGPLADLYGAVVTEALVYKDGSLTLSFDDERALEVSPGPHYEAFQVSGSWAGGEPWRLISLPGGGLAEWVVGER